TAPPGPRPLDEEAWTLAQTRAPERWQQRIPPHRGASPPAGVAPRRNAAGLEAHVRAAATASSASDAVAGPQGTAWQGDRRGFWRRQAIDPSCRLHFVSSMF
uniref:Uncharacterized protein n=2 Tax=Aegilops tauschii subsp. strangulata TaxID=200361 RepID=A0A453PQN6_AEGTS